MNKPGRLWLPGVEHVVSPNADDRPAETVVDLLVIHSISLPPGQYGERHIDDLFLNRLDPAAHPYFAGIADLRVSSHLLVRRDGTVTQFVALDRRAWHAGESNYCGRQRCNDFSIGIELEGCDEDPFTDAQYQRLGELTQAVVQRLPTIDTRHIVGHADIAPDRKTDPGPCFDWVRYRSLLATPDPRMT